MAIDAPSLLTSDIRGFLSAVPPRYATIATVNPDGGPHQIVIWYLLRGDQLIVNSRRGRRWPSNLGRERRANLCVYQGEDMVALNVVLERVYDGEAAQADIAEMAMRYDTPEVAQRVIQRFRTEQRVSFVLKPTSVFVHGEPI